MAGELKLQLKSRREPGKLMTGLAKAFATFGAAGKNPRWSWSARSSDDQTVVMTFWKDAFDYSSSPISYSTFGSPRLHIWKDKPGNRERIENLKWARDRCDGLMKVVIIEAKDLNVDKREIAESYAQRRMVMKLVELNEETGEFSAVNVGQ
jgi:hypothetical protein